ncbi:MAG: hypothetical protein EOO41_04045, partial [Methanobacteriota archaeon]
ACVPACSARILYALNALPLPTPGYALRFDALGHHRALPPIVRPAVTQCPAPVSSGFTLPRLFRFLAIPDVILLVRLMLLEQQVLLHVRASCAHILVDAAEALQALLFPFKWVHTYIPLCPPAVDITVLLDAPFPMLVGAATESLSDALPQAHHQLVVVDLNTGRVSVPPRCGTSGNSDSDSSSSANANALCYDPTAVWPAKMSRSLELSLRQFVKLEANAVEACADIERSAATAAGAHVVRALDSGDWNAAATPRCQPHACTQLIALHDASCITSVLAAHADSCSSRECRGAEMEGCVTAVRGDRACPAVDNTAPSTIQLHTFVSHPTCARFSITTSSNAAGAVAATAACVAARFASPVGGHQIARRATPQQGRPNARTGVTGAVSAQFGSPKSPGDLPGGAAGHAHVNVQGVQRAFLDVMLHLVGDYDAHFVDDAPVAANASSPTVESERAVWVVPE